MNETINERRVGERRGKGLSSDQERNEFMYDFWKRFFSDKPEMDRRKQADRRGSKSSSSLWGKVRSWFGG